MVDENKISFMSVTYNTIIETSRVRYVLLCCFIGNVKSFFYVKLIFSACQDIVGWKEAIKYFKHSCGRNDTLGENGRISFIHEMLC